MAQVLARLDASLGIVVPSANRRSGSTLLNCHPERREPRPNLTANPSQIVISSEREARDLQFRLAQAHDEATRLFHAEHNARGTNAQP